MAIDVISGRSTNSISGIINKKKGKKAVTEKVILSHRKATDRPSVVIKKQLTFHRNQTEFVLLRFLLEDHTK